MGNACCSGPVAPQARLLTTRKLFCLCTLRFYTIETPAGISPAERVALGPQEQHAERAEYQAQNLCTVRLPEQGEATKVWETPRGGGLEGSPAAVCADACGHASPLGSHAGPSTSVPCAGPAREQRQPAHGPVQGRHAAGPGAQPSCGATCGSSGSSAQAPVAAQSPAAEAGGALVRSPPDPPCQAQRLQALYALKALDCSVAPGVSAWPPQGCRALIQPT